MDATDTILTQYGLHVLPSRYSVQEWMAIALATPTGTDQAIQAIRAVLGSLPIGRRAIYRRM
jgi:hypothetical protein